MSDLLIRQFPCLSDNYGFLVHDPETGETATIDTPDADRILAEADAAGWRITQIWNTHHHFDHAGGNAAVRAATGARIIAPGYDAHRIPDIDVPVSDGDTVALGRHEARVLFTPGHTLGHVCYHFADDRIAFVGDTLFALGCGRLFEGSPEQMWTSLSRLAAWPEETRIYCAHEYTQANAAFAITIDPDNDALKTRIAQIDTARAAGEPTVPSTLQLELDTNPFLRAHLSSVKESMAMQNAEDVDVFTEIRRRKDNF